MSDNIPPLEIQMEIIQRIHEIKWVIQYRSVSKAWKSMIDSKEFVTAHTLRRRTHDDHRLFVRRRRGLVRGRKKVELISIADDDTFQHRNRRLSVPFPYYGSIIVDGSHGLFCFCQNDTDFIICNPSIRKTVSIQVPALPEKDYDIVGFGFCPGILDLKLVRIIYVLSGLRPYVVTSTRVEVYTLGSRGTWRRSSPSLSSNFPLKSFNIQDHTSAVINGVIYWTALVDRENSNDESRDHNVIVSFDLTSEQFTEVNLPDHLALNHDVSLSLYNLRESLAVLEFHYHTKYVIWMMIGNGCTRSFNKLYSIDAPTNINIPLGLRKSGASIIVLEKNCLPEDAVGIYEPEYAVGIYEPESKNITEIGILKVTDFVHSYKETLLLLGH